MGENSCIKEVKDKIQEIGVLCEQSLPFIAQAYDGLHGVSCTMDNIYDLSKYVDEISSALSTLSKVCVGLSAVPIVGVIAQQIPRIINPVKDVLVVTKKECKELGKTAKSIENTLSKVSHEVDMLNQKMVFVSQHYQDYEESLEMMDNVLRLFEGIRELCSQSELAKNLEIISDKIEKDVGNVIDRIQELQKQVQELENKVTELESKVFFKFNEFVKVAGSIIKVLSGIKEVIAPVTNIFQKVIDAIAPLRWVLNAASCIFNKILKPIIDKILNAFGISKLIKQLEEKLLKALGFDAVYQKFSELKQSVENELENVFSGMLKGMKDKIEDMENHLEDFASMDACNDLIQQFLKEAAKTFSGGELPPLNTPCNIIKSPRSEVISYIPLVKQKKKIAKSNTIYYEKRELPEIYCILEGEGSNQSSNKKELLNSVKKVKDVIDGVVDGWNQLLSQMSGIRDIFHNMKDCSYEIQLYEEILTTIEQGLFYMKKCIYIEAVSQVIDKITPYLNKEKESCKLLNENLHILGEEIDEIVGKMEEVSSHMPTQHDLDKLYEKTYSTIDGLDVTTQLINLGRKSIDKADMNKQYLGCINEHEKKVEDRIGKVISQLNDFSAEIVSIRGKSDEINIQGQKLIDLSNQLYDSGSGIINNKLFSYGAEVENKIHILNSLFDPISSIVQFLENNNSKQSEEFFKYVSVIFQWVNSVMDNQKIVYIIDLFVDECLPANRLINQMTEIKDQVEKIKNTIANEDMAVLTKDYQEKIEQLLDGKEKFFIEDTNEVITNFYVDNDLVYIANEIYQQYPKDGEDLKEVIHYIQSQSENIKKNLDMSLPIYMFQSWQQVIYLLGQMLKAVENYGTKEEWKYISCAISILEETLENSHRFLENREIDTFVYSERLIESKPSNISDTVQMIIQETIKLYKPYEKLEMGILSYWKEEECEALFNSVHQIIKQVGTMC